MAARLAPKRSAVVDGGPPFEKEVLWECRPANKGMYPVPETTQEAPNLSRLPDIAARFLVRICRRRIECHRMRTALSASFFSQFAPDFRRLLSAIRTRRTTAQ